MNSVERFEIQNIREDQNRLRQLMTNLDRRIDILARSMNSATEPSKPEPIEIKPAQEQKQPPPLPAATLPTEARPALPPLPKNEPPKPELTPVLPLPNEPEPSNDEPLELRVGTFWMARIGIVILITGLVFLGNYAYHRIVPLLGPWSKLSLLMLAGLGLGGTGYWMERGKESLRTFGRVLFAGGAATIYYTTYAAHYVQGLRVIESPLIGGVFLLAVAGGIAWYAERKRSETIASIAVLLSFYTSAINSIAGFTLFSSLLLTAVAIYFLVRHQWTRLSVLSLFATYGSYAYWRFHQFVQSASAESLEMGLGFLAGYWILFTAGTFFANGMTLRTADRTAFLSLNNIAFFSFAVHYFAIYQANGLWMFAIGFGGVLLGLSAVAAHRNSEALTVDGAYLAQGLIAIGAGLAAKFSGPQLSMVLALESSALLACTRRRHGLLYEIGAGLTALAAFVLAFNYIQFTGARSWSVGLLVAGLFIFNGWWIKQLRSEPTDLLISARSMAFVVPALFLIGAANWQVTPEAGRPAAFALLPLAGLAAFRIRLAELGLTAQLFVPFGGLLVFVQSVNSAAYPWWAPALVLLSALALLHWWQELGIGFSKNTSEAAQLVFAIVAVGTGICWMSSSFHGDAWLVATSIAAFGTVAYGLITRAWSISLVGQVFSILAIGTFAVEILSHQVTWTSAFTPVAAMALISVLISRWGVSRWPALPEPATYSKLSGYYRLAGALLFAAWAFEYIPFRMCVVFFAIGGALQIVVGSVMRVPARLVSGTLYIFAGLILFWLRLNQPTMWFDLLALLSIPTSLRISARLAGEPPLPKDIRNFMVLLALCSMWLWVTHWTLDLGARGQLTTTWTIFALIVFGAGLALRERIYRLGGFAVLGLAIGRLFLLDVWRFDSLYRIISFLVLGAALLTLSFVYHRCSESLRKYL
jgi:uncharacterized membrane protein